MLETGFLRAAGPVDDRAVATEGRMSTAGRAESSCALTRLPVVRSKHKSQCIGADCSEFYFCWPRVPANAKSDGVQAQGPCPSPPLGTGSAFI